MGNKNKKYRVVYKIITGVFNMLKNKNFIKHLWLLKYTTKIDKIMTKKDVEKLRQDILKSYKECTEFMKSYKKI